MNVLSIVKSLTMGHFISCGEKKCGRGDSIIHFFDVIKPSVAADEWLPMKNAAINWINPDCD